MILPRGRARRAALLSLSAFFVLAGANHFRVPGLYVDIVPPYLPAHVALVYASGVAEIVGGLAVLFPALRSRAGWALIGLLMAVFPANVHMALNPDSFPDVSPVALYARLPIQLVFVAWAYWATRPEAPASPPASR